LAPQKGFDILIDAMAHLDDRFHLNILGEGDNEMELKKQIKTLGLNEKISMLGFQENPYAFIERSDFFILSSRYEGLPNVVLESYVMGKPCIAFDMPGGTAEIIVDGESGILVKEFSALALAYAIKKAVKIDFDKDFIYNFCKENFSVEKIVGEYEESF
jgi:glycosyltransferase involved in cell wall biosynthesis